MGMFSTRDLCDPSGGLETEMRPLGPPGILIPEISGHQPWNQVFLTNFHTDFEKSFFPFPLSLRCFFFAFLAFLKHIQNFFFSFDDFEIPKYLEFAFELVSKF